MPTVDIEGLGKVEIDGNEPDLNTLKIIEKFKDFKNIEGTVNGIGHDKTLPRNSFGQIVAPEIPLSERFAVNAAPNLESRVATLKKFYPSVKQDPLNFDNFIVTDKNGKKFQLNDVSKTNIGDVVDLAKPTAQIVGSTIGAIGGTTMGGPVAGVGMAGVGMAGGSEVIERLGQLFGTEIERTPTEYLKDRALDIAIGASAEAAGPIVLKGLQRVVRGPIKFVERETAEGGVEKISDMALKMEQFATAGVTPTLTQVTENKITDTIGSIVSKFPFAAQTLKERAIIQQNQLGINVVDMASKLIGKEGRAATGEEAGAALREGIGSSDAKTGIYGADGFISRFRGQNAINYAEADKLIPKNLKIQPNKTVELFNEKIGTMDNLGAFKKLIGDEKIEAMFKALQENMADKNVLPYSQLKQIRTAIGDKISNYNMVEGFDRAFYKRLYGALSQDIESGVKLVGNDAYKALTKANNFHRENVTLIDDFLQPLIDKVNLDNVTNTLLKKAEDGPTQIRALRTALNDKQYNVVVSNIIDNLGKKETTDLLTKTGDLIETSKRTNYFNTNTFLKNWNKLSDESKTILFNSSPELKGVHKQIDNIARVANEIEKANPFGASLAGETSRQTGQNLLLGSAVGAATGTLGVTAGFLPAALTLLTVPVIGWGGAVASKAFSNPAFLKWLSKGVDIAGNKGVNGVIEHLGKIAPIMAQSDPESRIFSNQTYRITEQAADHYVKQEKAQAKQQELKKQQEQLKQPTIQQKPAAPIYKSPVSQGVTSPNVNMFAANTQAQGQSPTAGLTNIPQDQLNKYSTLFGKVV